MKKYITIVLDRDSLQMLVRKHSLEPGNDKLDIPHLTSAKVPGHFFGDNMNAIFTRELNELTESSFELIFLYSTINEAYHRHIPGMYVAMFECTKPVKPLSPFYVWVDVRTLRPGTFPNQFDVEALSYARRVLEVCSENGVRPWEKLGWLKTTSDVATATLASLGYRVIPPFQQFSVTPNSAILRVQTDKGHLYLKANNKREGKVTECISSVDPKLVRKPLYVDSEREWMLMEDYGPTLYDKMYRQDFENLRDLFARLQRKASKHVKRLVDAGVPRVDPGDVLRRTEKMLRDLTLSEGFDENAVRNDCRSVSILLKYMYENPKVPLTLCHGDLYDSNVIKCEKDNYVIFDWATASIDIPLDEMDCLVSNIMPVEDQSEEYEDSHLEHWADYESLEELKRLKRCLGLKFGLVTAIERYEYAVDKGLRPYLEEYDMVSLSKTLDAVNELVEEVS